MESIPAQPRLRTNMFPVYQRSAYDIMRKPSFSTGLVESRPSMANYTVSFARDDLVIAEGEHAVNQKTFSHSLVLNSSAPMDTSGAEWRFEPSPRPVVPTHFRTASVSVTSASARGSFRERIKSIDRAELNFAGEGENFDDNAAEEIAQAFADDLCSNVTVLRLAANSIGDRGAIALAKLLSSLKCRLQAMYLDGNQIGDAGMVAIAAALQSNTSLQILSLSNNRISLRGCEALSDALSHNSTLEILDLDQNPLSADGVVVLSDSLAINRSLRELSIRFCSAGTAGASALSVSLCANASLQRLLLDSNGFDDDAICALSTAVQYNRALRYLSLDSNHIQQRGAESLGEAMKTNRTLRVLTLNQCQMSDSTMTVLILALQEACADAGSLHELEMSNNSLDDQAADALAAALINSVSLKRLVIRGHCFSSVGLQALQAAIAVNTSLETLISSSTADSSMDDALVLASLEIRKDVKETLLLQESDQETDRLMRLVSYAIEHQHIETLQCCVSAAPFVAKHRELAVAIDAATVLLNKLNEKVRVASFSLQREIGNAKQLLNSDLSKVLQQQQSALQETECIAALQQALQAAEPFTTSMSLAALMDAADKCIVQLRQQLSNRIITLSSIMNTMSMDPLSRRLASKISFDMNALASQQQIMLSNAIAFNQWMMFITDLRAGIVLIKKSRNGTKKPITLQIVEPEQGTQNSFGAGSMISWGEGKSMMLAEIQKIARAGSEFSLIANERSVYLICSDDSQCQLLAQGFDKASKDAKQNQPSKPAAKPLSKWQKSSVEAEKVAVIEVAQVVRQETTIVQTVEQRTEVISETVVQDPKLDSDFNMFMAVLKSGIRLLKHNSNGGTNDRILSLIMPARLLSWGSNNGNIRLDQVQEIKEGKQTDTFKKHKSDAADNVCFSVIAKDRSLDFQCSSAEQCSLLVYGLRRLMTEKSLKGYQSNSEVGPTISRQNSQESKPVAVTAVNEAAAVPVAQVGEDSSISESDFYMFTSMVTDGIRLIKHNTNGGTNDRLLSFISSSRLISWGSVNGNIRLDQVQAIKTGKQTETFKKHPTSAADDVCFSFIAKDRSLDFECPNAEKCALLVKGFRRLVAQAQSKSL